jgi:hypothetical protein
MNQKEYKYNHFTFLHRILYFKLIATHSSIEPTLCAVNWRRLVKLVSVCTQNPTRLSPSRYEYRGFCPNLLFPCCIATEREELCPASALCIICFHGYGSISLQGLPPEGSTGHGTHAVFGKWLPVKQHYTSTGKEMPAEEEWNSYSINLQGNW